MKKSITILGLCCLFIFAGIAGEQESIPVPNQPVESPEEEALFAEWREQRKQWPEDHFDVEIEFFSSYLKSHSDAGASVYYALGLSYYRNQKLESSILNFNKAIELYPNFQSAYKLLCYSHMLLGNWKEAATAVYKSIELGDDDPRTYGILALVCLNNERFEEAAAAYQTAIDKDPKTVDWWKGLAKANIDLGDYVEAVVALKQIKGMLPEEAEYYQQLIDENEQLIANNNSPLETPVY